MLRFYLTEVKSIISVQWRDSTRPRPHCIITETKKSGSHENNEPLQNINRIEDHYKRWNMEYEHAMGWRSTQTKQLTKEIKAS